MTPNSKITKSDLRQFVADYHRMLAQWQQTRDGTIARADGPMMQGIGFECLRGGAYRPMNYVCTLVTPEQGIGFLEQFLQKWPRELLPRQHAEYHVRLFENMKHEFQPSILGNFDAWEMLERWEKSAVTKGHQAYGLATLNAYFSRDDRARYWCAQFPKLVEAVAYPWQPWDLQRKAFLDTLIDWLDAGDAKPRLQQILKERRKKEGFL
jgi:hypothetical protein